MIKTMFLFNSIDINSILFIKLKQNITKKQINNLRLLSKNKIKDNNNNLILLEGNRLIKDAIIFQLKPFQIYLTENYINNIIKKQHQDQDQEKNLSDKIFLNKLNNLSSLIYYIDSDILSKVSNVENSQGIIALFNKPNIPLNFNKINPLIPPLILVCDKLSDPGNLGSIIRSSYIFGVDMILTIETCDVWVKFHLLLNIYFLFV